MALSRRQFFRRLWKPGDEPSPQRIARYETLEAYTRTQLLPYDFTLTPDQERGLLASIRTVLEKTPDNELFSNVVRGKLEEVVEARIQPWRERNHLAAQSGRLREIRNAAPDYVAAFLNVQASPQLIEQFKETYRIDSLPELEQLLTNQVRHWIEEVDDRLIAQYDILSVQDLVFAQLRSWC